MTSKRTWSKESNWAVISSDKRWRLEVATKVDGSKHFLLWDLNKQGVEAMIKAGIPSLQAGADLVQDIEEQEVAAAASRAPAGQSGPAFDDSVLTDFS